MALTFNGSSSSLTRSGTLVASYPFTIFAWVRAASSQTGFIAELAVEPGPNGTHEGHGMLASGSRMLAWSTVGNGVAAYSSTYLQNGVWMPAMAVFSSDSVRRIYLGSGAPITHTTALNQNPSLLNAFAIGKQAQRSANYWAGDIASVGLWRSELTAADFATLAGGAVPSTVQSSTLIDYWSLSTQAATQTGANGYVLTATNTAQASSHPISEGEAVPPTMTGSISVTGLGISGYTLSWAAATDNVAVTAYELSLDGGATYTNIGNVLTITVSGRSPGSTDQVRVRARDAVGNLSAPLSVAVTLLTDDVAPTMNGTLTVTAITTTSYTLSWSAASDNVGVSGYELSVDGGGSYAAIGNVLTIGVSGRTPGTTDAVRVRAKDAAGNASVPLSANVNLLTGGDVTAPVLTGSITVTGLTSTGYTLSWGQGSDNVGVTAYERSLDGGASWVNVGNVLTVTITGRTPGSVDPVQVRARDAAGNVSTPPLSTTVTLPSGGTAVLTTPPMKNNAGTLLANLTGVTVNVYNASTGALVVRKTGLSSNAAGMVTISDSALVSGTSYAYEVVTPSNGRRLPTGTAA